MSQLHDRIRFLYAQLDPTGREWNKTRLAGASGIDRRRLTEILERDADMRVEGELTGLARAFGIDIVEFFVDEPSFLGQTEEQQLLRIALKQEEIRQLVLWTAQMPPAQRRTLFELLRLPTGLKILQNAMEFVKQLEADTTGD